MFLDPLTIPAMDYEPPSGPTSLARPGEMNGRSRLTLSQIRQIRKLCAMGERHKSIAAKFGIGVRHVSNINRGACWSGIE